MYKAHAHTHKCTHTLTQQTHMILLYTPFGPHAGVACCPCSRRTHIHTHTQDALVHTFWSTCRSGLLPMFKAHTHTHKFTNTHKMLSYTPFGPHAGVACCPCTRHTHTHTRYSRTHLLVYMQEWLVAHVQDTHTHTHKMLSYTPFGPHAGVACCPYTRHPWAAGLESPKESCTVARADKCLLFHSFNTSWRRKCVLKQGLNMINAKANLFP